SGAYRYDASVSSEGETIGSGSMAFMVVVPMDVMFYALPAAALGSVLALLWGARKPLTIKKVIIPIVKGTKVSFKLTNRTKHAFKNVIITDTVPARIAAAGVTPKPTTSTKMPNGTIRLEWHIAHVLPKEKRDFRYTLNKRKYFLPKAKVKYERDRELEERLAKKELKKIKRGIMAKLHGKPRPAAHAQAKPHRPAAKPSTRPVRKAVRKPASAKPSKPAVRKPASAKPSKPAVRKPASAKPSKPAVQKKKR
ncbi:MAG: hypothetical protein QXD77_03540, partial [Candidatus Aenigmatarchaeota archaeon]